jgi:hypothetical protein
MFKTDRKSCKGENWYEILKEYKFDYLRVNKYFPTVKILFTIFVYFRRTPYTKLLLYLKNPSVPSKIPRSQDKI